MNDRTSASTSQTPGPPRAERRSTCCARCRSANAYANLALPAILNERQIDSRDAAFATELTYGTCRAIGLLDAIIASAATGQPIRSDPVLLDLLRLGAYQLLRMRVDAHAAVDTTVEQAAIEFDTARAGFRQRGAPQHLQARRGVVGRRTRAAVRHRPIGHTPSPTHKCW